MTCLARAARLLHAILLAGALVPAIAAAELDTFDDVPGSLLILPYFEVDLDDPNGPDTVFSVHNRSGAPIIAAVSLNTDWGVSTLSFALFLQAHDVQEIRLRDVFRGYFPNLDPPPPFCPTLGRIAPEQIETAVAAHRGEADGALCSGQDFGDDLLRGSIFIISPAPFICDSPAAPAGVFESGENALWGDYYLIDRGNRFAAGELLQSLEAAAALQFASLQGATPAIQEDVAPRWAARYVTSEDDTTDLLAFRFVPTFQPANCNDGPSWFPLSQQELFIIDEDGDAIELNTFRPFPLGANRVRVDSISLPLPPTFNSGWLFVDYSSPLAASNGTSSEPPTSLSSLRIGSNGATLQRGLNFP